MPVSGPTTNHEEIRRWAQLHGASPAVLLPVIVDHIPAVLCFVVAQQADDHLPTLVITWVDFFIKFDALGLSLVYDSDRPGYNEILQIETKDPFVPEAYRRSARF